MSKPQFSILVPTRNRRELLCESALPSVLRQDHQNFEVVVCDNASHDDTTPAVQALGDSRVKVHRTEEWIPKEHFFQWCIQFAEGDYVVWFFDDDAMCQGALRKVEHLLAIKRVDLVTFARNCVYFYPDYPDEQVSNTLIIPAFKGSAISYDSRKHLEFIFSSMEIQLPTPMVSNAFYKTDALREIISKHGNLFPHGHMGDYNIACFSLSHVDEFVYIDDPLVLFGHWSSNTSAQLHELETTMPEYQEWVAWATDNLVSRMPWKRYLWPNVVAAALADMSRILDLGMDIDPLVYNQCIARELKRLSAARDIKSLQDDFYAHVVRRSDTLFMPDVFRVEMGPPCHAFIDGDEDIEAYAAMDQNAVIGIRRNARPKFVNGGRNFDTIQGATEYFESTVH